MLIKVCRNALLLMLCSCFLLSAFPAVGIAESGSTASNPDSLFYPKTELPAHDTTQRPNTYSTWVMLVQTIFALIFIIGLFLIIMKAISKKHNRWMMNQSVRTLGGVALGQNKSLQLVEIGRSIYVVGIGDNVQLIDKIDNAEEVEYILDTINHRQNQGNSVFSMGAWFRKRRAQAEPQDDAVHASFHQLFQEKMQQLATRNKMVENLLQDEKQIERSNENEKI